MYSHIYKPRAKNVRASKHASGKKTTLGDVRRLYPENGAEESGKQKSGEKSLLESQNSLRVNGGRFPVLKPLSTKEERVKRESLYMAKRFSEAKKADIILSMQDGNLGNIN